MKSIFSIKKAGLLFLGITALVVSVQRIEATDKKAYIALIIDDFGYGGEGTEEILGMDIALFR